MNGAPEERRRSLVPHSNSASAECAGDADIDSSAFIFKSERSSNLYADETELELQGKIARCGRNILSEKDQEKAAALSSGRPKSALPVPTSRLPVACADDTHTQHSKMPSFGFSSSASSPAISRDAAEIARLKEALRSSNSRYEQTLALLKKQVGTEDKDKNQCEHCVETSMTTISLKAENERLQNEINELEAFKQSKRDFDKLKMDLETAHNDLVRASNKLHAREIEDQIKSDEIDELTTSLTAAKRRIADLESDNSHSSQNTLMKDKEISDLRSHLTATLSELGGLRDEINRFKHMESDMDSLIQDRADLESRLLESEREARELGVMNVEIKTNAKKQLLQAEEYVNSQNLKISKLEETINMQQTASNSLTAEISRLTSVVDSASTVSRRLQQSLALTSDMEGQIKNLQDSLKQSEFTRLTLERVKDTIEFEKKEAKSQAWAAEQQRDKLQENLYITEQELIQVKDVSFKFQQSFENTLRILENSKKESELVITSLRTDLAKVKSIADEKNAEGEGLKRRLQLVESEVERVREEKADLETSKDILSHSKMQLEASVLELRGSITEREEKLVEVQETLSKSQQQLAALSEEKSNLETQIAVLTSEMSEFRSQLDLKNGEISDLKYTHMGETQSLTEAHSKALEDVLSQKKELESVVETSQALADSMAKDFETKTAEFAKTIQSNENSIRELAQEVEKYRDLAESRMSNINDRNSLISSQANYIDTLQNAKLEMDSRLSLAQAENERCHSLIEELKIEITKLKAQINLANDSEEAFKEKLKSTEEALSVKEAEMAELEDLLCDARQKIALADESMASTEETVRNLQNKYEQTHQAILDVQEKLEGALSEKYELASKLQAAQELVSELEYRINVIDQQEKSQLSTEFQTRLDEADSMLKRMKTSMQEQEETIAQLECQLSARELQIKELESSNLNTQQALKNAESRLHFLDARVKELHEKLEEQSQTCREHSDALNRLSLEAHEKSNEHQQTVDSYQSRLSCAQLECADLLSKLEKLSEQLENNQKLCQEREIQIEHERSQAAAQISELNEALLSEREIQERGIVEKSEQENKIGHFQQQSFLLQKNVEELTSLLESTKAELELTKEQAVQSMSALSQELQTTKSDRQSFRDLAESEKEHAKVQAKELFSEIENLKLLLATERENIQLLKLSKSELESQLDEAKSQSETSTNGLLFALENSRICESELKLRASELENELASLQSAFEEQQREKESLQSEFQAIKEDAISRSAQVSEKDSTIVQLEEQLRCMREEVSEWKSFATDVYLKVKNLKLGIESFETKTNELNEVVAAKSVEIDSMQQRLNSEADSMESSAARIRKLQSEIEGLEDTKLSLLEFLDAKDAELAKFSKTIQEKDEELQIALQSVEAMKKDQQELSDAYRDKDMTVKEFEVSLLAIQEALDGRDEKILSLQTELDESHNKLGSLEKRLMEVDEQCIRAAEEITTLREEVAELEAAARSNEGIVVELTECRNSMKVRDDRISELESALKTAKDRFESDAVKIDKLMIEKVELVTLSETLKSRTALLEEMERDHLRDIDVLKSELNQLKQVLIAQADSIAEAEALASASREENLSLKEKVIHMLEKNEAAQTEISQLLKSEADIKDRLQSIEKKATDLAESICDFGLKNECDCWEVLESFVKNAQERVKSLEEAVEILEKTKGENPDKKETDLVIEELRAALAEKSQLAEEYEKRAQDNEERNQILQDTSINLTRENKKLLTVKQKLEKNNEKLQKQLEAAQALAAISASANTTIVTESHVTPTRTKRSGPSDDSPAKIPRTEGKPKQAQQLPQVAPQRSRRMTLAAKRTDLTEKDPDSENCKQQ
ncbi:hypothetical protein HDU83_001868 [Entophlyctis luteolus]|nr:hypothetical protein HDU83_001868 [Entophlyctis luteolus]